MCVDLLSSPTQFSSLETLLESYNASTTEKLALLISQLQTMTSSVSELQAGVEGHSKQLTSLEAEVRAVVASLAEVRESVLQRIEELERVTGGMVEEEDVVRIFGEELNKTVERKDSILWSWLSRVMICLFINTLPILIMWLRLCMYMYLYITAPNLSEHGHVYLHV